MQNISDYFLYLSVYLPSVIGPLLCVAILFSIREEKFKKRAQLGFVVAGSIFGCILSAWTLQTIVDHLDPDVGIPILYTFVFFPLATLMACLSIVFNDIQTWPSFSTWKSYWKISVYLLFVGLFAAPAVGLLIRNSVSSVNAYSIKQECQRQCETLSREHQLKEGIDEHSCKAQMCL